MRHHLQAKRVGQALSSAGFEVLNRVVLNQVLVRAKTDEATLRVIEKVQKGGEVWFGSSVWQTRPAFRISLSSFRTEEVHINRLIDLLKSIGPEG